MLRMQNPLVTMPLMYNTHVLCVGARVSAFQSARGLRWISKTGFRSKFQALVFGGLVVQLAVQE